MVGKTRRICLFGVTRSARRAAFVFTCVAPFFGATAAQADSYGCVSGDGAWVKEACYVDIDGAPRYGHEVLGDTPEWDALRVILGPKGRTANGGNARVVLRQDGHVFEDTLPRIEDLDSDGIPELTVVQSSFNAGARLAVVTVTPVSLSTATPYIGQAFRWLAPVGAADLDGDGATELAFIDRPHLAKTLRVWRYRDGALQMVGDLAGLTNHKIGEAFISSGIRRCVSGPEIITVDAQWRNVMATQLRNGKLITRRIGAFTGPKSLEAALNCTD